MEYVYNNTKLLRLSDMAYPRYYSNLVFDFPNTTFGYPLFTSVLHNFGYEYVYETEKPQGDVVEEIQPVLGEDGKYYKAYTSRDFTEEEIASNLQSAKDQLIFGSYDVYLADLDSGVSWSFEGNDYIFKISLPNKMIWDNCKFIFESSSDPVMIRTEENAILDLTKDNFEIFYKFMSDQYKLIRDRYYTFVRDVQGTALIGDLPDQPVSFKE